MTDKKPLSAAQAKRETKAVKLAKLDPPQQVFTLRRKGRVIGQFTVEQMLEQMSGVDRPLLRERLRTGQRDFDRLAAPKRPPHGPHGRCPPHKVQG